MCIYDLNTFKKVLTILYMCVCVYSLPARMNVHHMQGLWVVMSIHLGPGSQTRVLIENSKHFELLLHLSILALIFGHIV